MLLSTAAVLLAASFASAQSVVTIQVGAEASTPGGIFQFTPPSITAANGTVVNFVFSGEPGNHSVTQSSFSNPCNPTSGGFDSGWVFLPEAGLSPSPQWNLTILDDSQPIWFYCKQLLPAPHCSAGMVGAINAPTSGSATFSAYQSAAESFTGIPGQGVGVFANAQASASGPPGPVPSGASLLGTPASGSSSNSTGSGSGSAAGSAAAPSGSTSGAMSVSFGTRSMAALVFGVVGLLL
ncbi:hypothetical protein BDN72DRAFT_482501 [Pluteus cervinus]|uniref:Uncharacterized protein n=1 Tax=Pluteus cervinus TaxID=181527 RepID=A0ACD3AZH0_9AGAR|nr:hypothetical protein BDN72DRAFT_482501 [Pluteus cervinus]